MKNIALSLITLLMSFSVFAQTSSDPQKPYVILACEPKLAGDERYNLDIVVDGTSIKLLIHIFVFGQDRSENFEMEAVDRRSSDSTILRATSAPALMLVVAKKGRLNAAGQPSFGGVFRGGGEYGVYNVVCVKKDPPKPPAPEKVKAPESATSVPAPVASAPVSAESAPAVAPASTDHSSGAPVPFTP